MRFGNSTLIDLASVISCKLRSVPLIAQQYSRQSVCSAVYGLCTRLQVVERDLDHDCRAFLIESR